MLNRGFTSHSQIILSLLYNAKFFDFYFLLKTKVLTSALHEIFNKQSSAFALKINCSPQIESAKLKVFYL